MGRQESPDTGRKHRQTRANADLWVPVKSSLGGFFVHGACQYRCRHLSIEQYRNSQARSYKLPGSISWTVVLLFFEACFTPVSSKVAQGDEQRSDVYLCNSKPFASNRELRRPDSSNNTADQLLLCNYEILLLFYCSVSTTLISSAEGVSHCPE